VNATTSDSQQLIKRSSGFRFPVSRKMTVGTDVVSSMSLVSPPLAALVAGGWQRKRSVAPVKWSAIFFR